VRLFRRRKKTVAPAPAAHETIRATQPAAPMTDLESALSQIDAGGQSLREVLATDADIDDLRDGTGPILRRALDNVAPDECDG
jgi:ABC-type transporter Mla subunit MlaD